MPLNFIPNQPILFEDPLFVGQSCLNKDDRAYAQLLQPLDTMCIEFNNASTGLTIGCDMNTELNQITNGAFDPLLTGWQELDLTTGALSTPSNWSYTGTGVICPIVSALHTTTGIPTGNLVMISMFTADPTIQISIGIGSAASNTWNTITSVSVNSDGRAVAILYATTGAEIFFLTNGATEIRDVIIRDITYSYCFFPDTASSYWSYVESLNGYELLGTNGSPQPLLLNGYFVTGEYYKITFKVKNMPIAGANYVYVADNTTGDILLTANDNKEYTFYYTHTNATTQITLNVSDWSNMLETLIYDFKVESLGSNFDISIVDLDDNLVSTTYNLSSGSFPLQFFEDKIVWCFQLDLLDVDVHYEYAYIQYGCYKVLISDVDLAENYYSKTVINYQETHDCSVMVVGDNNGSAFDFFFNDPSTSVSFTLRQRLRLLQFNPTYPTKLEEYLYSNGNNIRTYAETAKIRSAWFDYVDEPTHDVIRLQLLSDTLTIDQTEFYCLAEDYEPEWSENGKYNLAQSRVTLKAVVEKSLFNKSC